MVGERESGRFRGGCRYDLDALLVEPRVCGARGAVALVELWWKAGWQDRTEKERR